MAAQNVSKIYIRGLGLVETSPEHKKDYENECARIRMKMQYHGECHVTKANINRCDGICVGCPFRSAGKFVSIHDTVQTDSALTYADVLPASEAYSPEGVLARKTLSEELSRIFADLTDEERRSIRARHGRNPRHQTHHTELPKTSAFCSAEKPASGAS